MWLLYKKHWSEKSLTDEPRSSGWKTDSPCHVLLLRPEDLYRRKPEDLRDIQEESEMRLSRSDWS